MPASFQFELVLPEKIVVSKPAVLVTVPGSEGDFGVLSGHAPVITQVKTGVIELSEQEEGIVSEQFFVAGGFAEVTAERCTVLADEAVEVSALDRTKIEEEIKSLNEKLAALGPEDDHNPIEKKLSVARAKLLAAQSKSQH